MYISAVVDDDNEIIGPSTRDSVWGDWITSSLTLLEYVPGDGTDSNGCREHYKFRKIFLGPTRNRAPDFTADVVFARQNHLHT